MNGQGGVIERVTEGPSFNGYALNDPTYLVRFDSPVSVPNANGRPSWNDGIEAFWYDGLDLV